MTEGISHSQTISQCRAINHGQAISRLLDILQCQAISRLLDVVGVRTMLKWYQSFTQQKQQEDDLEQVYVKSKQRFIDLTKNKDEDGKT
jgi:thymidylate synthase